MQKNLLPFVGQKSNVLVNDFIDFSESVVFSINALQGKEFLVLKTGNLYIGTREMLFTHFQGIEIMDCYPYGTPLNSIPSDERMRRTIQEMNRRFGDCYHPPAWR